MDARMQEMLTWADKAAKIAERYPEDVRSFVTTLALESLLMKDAKRRLYKYETYQDLMLELGTPKRAALELPPWCEPGEIKQCYRNAYERVIGDDNLTYVEGYALHSFFPVSHAWVEDADGRIIDPTWTNLNEKQTHAFYLGVKFDTDFLLRRSAETGWISFFAGDWTRRSEILQLGFVMDGDVAIEMGEM